MPLWGTQAVSNVSALSQESQLSTLPHGQIKPGSKPTVKLLPMFRHPLQSWLALFLARGHFYGMLTTLHVWPVYIYCMIDQLTEKCVRHMEGASGLPGLRLLPKPSSFGSLPAEAPVTEASSTVEKGIRLMTHCFGYTDAKPEVALLQLVQPLSTLALSAAFLQEPGPKQHEIWQKQQCMSGSFSLPLVSLSHSGLCF